jgi:hypothetical protein
MYAAYCSDPASVKLHITAQERVNGVGEINDETTWPTAPQRLAQLTVPWLIEPEMGGYLLPSASIPS